jgi:LacI family transcriptional regulator
MANEAVKLSLQLVNNEEAERTEHKLFMPILVRRASVGNIK